MFLIKKNSQPFIDTSLEIACIKAIKRNSSKKFTTEKMTFNWGIIWETFNPLLVAGWSYFFTLVLEEETLTWLTLFFYYFWFGFSNLLQRQSI